MRYLVGLAVGGIMENPNVTYENIETIEADSPEDARLIYNKKHFCHYYYGEVLGIVQETRVPRQKLIDKDILLKVLHEDESKIIGWYNNPDKKEGCFLGLDLAEQEVSGAQEIEAISVEWILDYISTHHQWAIGASYIIKMIETWRKEIV